MTFLRWFFYFNLGAARPWFLGLALVLSWPAAAREILSTPQQQQEYQQKPLIYLVLDRKQRQLQVWQENGLKLHSYAVAVGKPESPTPTGQFTILSKIPNPTWEHIRTGEHFAPGKPGNPLGPFYLGFHRLGRDEWGFHGTNQPDSIGKAVTHGCVRLRNQDIDELFPLVQVGTVLRVI